VANVDVQDNLKTDNKEEKNQNQDQTNKQKETETVVKNAKHAKDRYT
jgi:hypothetical protein